MSTQDPSEVTYQEWVRKGGMMVRAESLEPHQDGSVYQQLLAQGVRPENYGVYSDPLYNKETLVNFLQDIQTGHISCRAGADILMDRIKQHVEKKLFEASQYF